MGLDASVPNNPCCWSAASVGLNPVDLLKIWGELDRPGTWKQRRSSPMESRLDTRKIVCLLYQSSHLPGRFHEGDLAQRFVHPVHALQPTFCLRNAVRSFQGRSFGRQPGDCHYLQILGR